MAGMSIGAGVFLLASVWAIARSPEVRKSLRQMLSHPLTWATFAFFLVAWASLVAANSSVPLGIPVSGYGELKKFHHFLYPAVVALAFLFTGDALEKHPFWKIWGGMGIFCGLLAVLQFFGADLFPAAWLGSRFFRPVGQTGRFHGQGLMFFHLSFASCMSFVAAAGVARVLWPLRWDGRKEKIFWGLVALVGSFGVYFSYSRIALAGLAVLVAFLCFLKKPLWGALAAVLVVAAGFALWRESPSLRLRFELSTGSNAERILMWESAWKMFEDRPLLGFGFGRSGTYTPAYAEKILGKKPWFTSHAHDNFLDELAANGLLGLLAYLSWWLVLFVSAWKSFLAAKEKWLPAAALGAFLVFQVNGLTQVNFWDGKSQHTLMIWAGVTLALALRRIRKEEMSFR
jgi:O-antigen ligase